MKWYDMNGNEWNGMGWIGREWGRRNGMHE